MKRWICIMSVGAAVALALQPAAAQDWKKKTRQVERGSVVASLYPSNSCDVSNWRLGQIIGGPANGATAYRFELQGGTFGRNFMLERVSGDPELVDLDIVFVDEGDHISPRTVAEFATREVGGEAGKVPKGAVVAYVCLHSLPEGRGLNASFEYAAGAGVKAPAAANKNR